MVDERLRFFYLSQAYNSLKADPMDVKTLFGEILEGGREDGEKIARCFRKFSSDNMKRPRKRFNEFIHRSDDPKQWAQFLLHENNREESVWKDRLMERFAVCLIKWWERNGSVSSTVADEHLRQFLTRITDVGSLELTDTDYRRWRLAVLRDSIGALMEGLLLDDDILL